MPKVATLPMTGRVKAKSAYGIQLEEMPDVWLNWSKEEYRKEPWDAEDVEKGDYVDLEVSGKYIKSITLIEPPTGESMVSRPDPIQEDLDPFEGLEAEGLHHAPRSPIATARDDSIQRQVALKCAVELAIGMRGVLVEGQTAGPLNADFVLSIYRKFRSALSEEAE